MYTLRRWRWVPAAQRGRGMSTIFAASSGTGKCGVAVLRVSGPDASVAVKQLTKISAAFPKSRAATLRTLVCPKQGNAIDQALVFWFPGPRSFTGEDLAEFHVHGGPAVVNATLRALSSLGATFRPAEPGEFTRRAFAAGKMDLTQVEGLGDLIHAETEAQRRSALRQMEGTAYRISEKWTRKLTEALANLEAYIDFGESEEIETDVVARTRQIVSELEDEFKTHLEDARRGERLRDGVHVAIIGPPNVGKSSLLNVLAERPAAIVSHIAGTTRDVVETRLDISGYPVVIMDTAGFRDLTLASDDVEREGIQRAIHNANRADLVILVEEAKTFMQHSRYTDNTLSNIMNTAPARMHLINKVDLLTSSELKRLEYNDRLGNQDPPCILSCKTGRGLDNVLSHLTKKVRTLCASTQAEDSPILTRERQRRHVERALEHLKIFQDAIGSDIKDVDFAIICRDLRLALRELGYLTGKVSSDKILDVIFSSFCIGK